MTSEQIRSLLFQKPSCDLDAYKIGDALCWVWKDFQSQNPDQACIRVRTMNLLVICGSPADAVGVADQLQDIAQLYPGRVVAVVLDEEYDGPIQGWYRIEHPAGHPEQLGCELVGLHCSGNGQPLPSLLAPLWHQGLPLFFWWCGRPRYGEPWLNHLMETAQRIILDTGGTGSASRAMGEAIQAAEPMARVGDMVEDRYHQELAFSDLNWGRLRAWRELVASLFDVEERRVMLDGLQEIQIVTWSMPRDITPSVHALYTLGWLARQLNYRVSKCLEASAEGQTATLSPINGHGRKSECKVNLLYHPTQDDELVARLSRVILIGEHEGEPFRLAVERDERDTSTLLRKSGSLTRPMLRNALQLARVSSRQLMAGELETFGRDSIFEGSLRRALDLAGAQPRMAARS